MAANEPGTTKAQIGLIGLGVMGENLALNIERNGFPVAVFNRHTDKVDRFMANEAKGKNIIGCKSDQEFIAALAKPRKIILLVKAGDPVDSTINNFKQYLDKGDIIIDAGNSHFQDTRRRQTQLATEGFHFIGSGVSGGEEGALWGPSLMPGGDREAYEQIRPIWEKISAHVNGEPCCTYLGPDGAGHFVKMVHNGIEYGDMQLLAEAYDLMRRGLGLSVDQTAEIFDKWNKGVLSSFLVEITSKILTVKDQDTNKYLIDLILDVAGQKGTGKWTAEIADDLAIPVPTIDAALSARLLSALKADRIEGSKTLTGPTINNQDVNVSEFVKALEQAVYAGRICSYAQGMALIAAGSKEYKWDIDLCETARIWRGGCIIRSVFLEDIRQVFSRNKNLSNILFDKQVGSVLASCQQAWRQVITEAVKLGIPAPALSASLAYYDSLRTASLPQNLIQAQRDFFGAHTYQRVDKPELGFVHTDWVNLVKVKAGKTS
jgi:6-phosphogluconate dehydrogenase